MTEATQALLPVTPELLACPFCGGEAQRVTLGEDEPNNAGGDVITCTRCQASSHVEFGRKENLVDRWNTRSQSHSLPGDVGTVRADLEDLLEDIEDEWIDHYLRPDSAERAKCKRCGGDDFFKSSIEHKPGCLVGRIRAALTPSALSGDAGEKKVWRVICWDSEDDRCEFNFATRADYDAFMAGKPKEIAVNDIIEVYQHTAYSALATLATEAK